MNPIELANKLEDLDDELVEIQKNMHRLSASSKSELELKTAMHNESVSLSKVRQELALLIYSLAP